jgi:hypothetical protein
MGISDPMFNGDLQKRVTELERQLRNITSGRRLEDASIGARGIVVRDEGSIIIDGGGFRVKNIDGIDVVFFGDVAGGAGISRGWVFRYDTGEVAFELQGQIGDQFWGFRDESGNIIVSSDGASDAGLARPYLNYRLVPTTSAESSTPWPMWPSTTSGSAVGLLEGVNPIWHPKFSTRVVCLTSGGGNVDWSLKFDGVTAASGTGTIPSTTFDTPGWGTTIKPADAVNITVEANVTGGATRAFIQVTRLYGTQS